MTGLTCPTARTAGWLAVPAMLLATGPTHADGAAALFGMDRVHTIHISFSAEAFKEITPAGGQRRPYGFGGPGGFGGQGGPQPGFGGQGGPMGPMPPDFGPGGPPGNINTGAPR